MYLNGLINFSPFEHLYSATVADKSLLLHDSDGKLVTLGPEHNNVFDVRQAAMRKVFVDAALYGMASGAFYGVFIDRANWALGCVQWDACRKVVAVACGLLRCARRW